MIYRALNFVLWPVWFIFTLRVAWREKSWRYFRQRLGYGYPSYDKQPVWIHCASVGEVNTWAPLHQLLVKRYPQLKFVISTNTPTGASIVAKHAFMNTQHVYLPVDTSAAVMRFFLSLNPRLAIVMETELWPELYRQCQRWDVPLLIVNARLSHKTLNTTAWLKQQYAIALQSVTHILCRSQADADAYAALGAETGKIRVVGNLKFAAQEQMKESVLHNFTDRSYVLAASTHDDEEWQLANMWENLVHSLDSGNYLLVIAPRHPQRREELLQKLSSLNLKIAVRSRGDVITPNTQIYLADTLGELVSFMRHAQAVFMGGSLVKRGGQNLLEPARLGKAILFGPHMHNFQSEADLFIHNRACIQIYSAEELAAQLKVLLRDDVLRDALGVAAKALVESQKDMAKRYLTIIGDYFDSVLSS